jgi:hypothetical protein
VIDTPFVADKFAAVIDPYKLEPPEVVETPIAKPVGVTAAPFRLRLVTIND